MSNQTEKPKNAWDEKELGVLWKRKAKSSGETFFTGKINLKSQGFDKDISVIVFTNKTKKQDNHPDARIYFSEDRPKTSATTTAKPAAKAAAPVAAPAAAPDDDQII